MSIALRNFSLKPFFACLILILFYQVSFAQDVLHKWEVKPYVGIEQARFDWSIAGNTAGTNPNILSELIWKNLKGPGFGLNVKYLITNRLSVKETTSIVILPKVMQKIPIMQMITGKMHFISTC